MTVTVSINSHEIKDLKNLKIEVQTDESDQLILLKEEEGFLILPSFDPEKVKIIRLFIEYNGKKYISPDMGYSFVRVANHYCSVDILTKKRAKKTYSKPGHCHMALSAEEMKKNWVTICLWGNERNTSYKRAF